MHNRDSITIINVFWSQQAGCFRADNGPRKRFKFLYWPSVQHFSLKAKPDVYSDAFTILWLHPLGTFNFLTSCHTVIFLNPTTLLFFATLPHCYFLKPCHTVKPCHAVIFSNPATLWNPATLLFFETPTYCYFLQPAHCYFCNLHTVIFHFAKTVLNMYTVW